MNEQSPQILLSKIKLITLIAWIMSFFIVFAEVHSKSQSKSTAGLKQAQTGAKKTQKLYGKSYALVIGVNEPQGAWAPLKSAQQDAKMFADHLESRGFEVTLLMGKDAKKKEILKQLQTQLPQKVTAGDRFIFYFAGHGQTQTLGKGKKVGYIVPADGKKEDGQDEWHTYLSMRELRSLLTDYIVSKHTLLVFDSCFSGLMFTRGGLRRPNLNARSYLKRSGVMAITAGGEGELALDGLFTPTFIQALSGEADENADGMTSFQELALYTRREVRARQEEQNPQFGVISGSGQMIFDAKSLGQSISPIIPQSMVLTKNLDSANNSSMQIWTATAVTGGLLTLAGTGLSLYARSSYTDLQNEEDTIYNQKVRAGEDSKYIAQNNLGIGIVVIGGAALSYGLYELLRPSPNKPMTSSLSSSSNLVAFIPDLLNQSVTLKLTW